MFAAADKSHITSQVKLLSALIQLPMGYVEGFLPEKDEHNFVDGIDKRKLPESLPNSFKGMNPFGTLVWYFNSKRELSYADSLLSQDIEERIKGLCRRYGIPFGLRRRAVNKQELTSRTKEFEIFEILKQLDIGWNPARNCRAIDVLLATSMISVGVDINRLGLMVVTGQPKNTSEYIKPLAVLVDKSRASFSLSIIRTEPETGHISRHFLVTTNRYTGLSSQQVSHLILTSAGSGPSGLIDRCRQTHTRYW